MDVELFIRNHCFDWKNNEPTYQNFISNFEQEVFKFKIKLEGYYEYNKVLLESFFNQRSIEHYEIMIDAYSEEINEYGPLLRDECKNSYIIKQCNLLGLFLESTLHMFLSVYSAEYKKYFLDKTNQANKTGNFDFITFNDLIEFCTTKNIFNVEHLEVLKKIAKYRNGINFINREKLIDHDEYVKVLYAIGSLFNEMQNRLPS